jgi:hypothetical protein
MMKIAFRVIFIFKMAADKIGKISMFSNFNENWYLELFRSEEMIGNDENCIQGHFYDATVSKMATNKIDKLLMVSDFNENWYLGVFWSEGLVGVLNSDMGVAWGLLCFHSNTIKPSYYYYYYYYSSSSSRRELVRPNSQRLRIRSLLSFTGRWIPISRGTIRSWNFQNDRRCHGNREHMSNSLTSLISETTKGISTRLGIWLVEYFDQKNRDRMAADKIGIISMFSDFNENWYQGLFWSVANC